MSLEHLQNPEDALHCAAKGDNPDAELDALRQTCARQQIQIQEIQAQLLEVLNSTWWRIGEMPRLLGRRYPKLARAFRFFAWSAGKFFYYARRGILFNRVADYSRRRAIMKQAQQKNLVKALGLKLQEEGKRNPADIILPLSEAPVVSIVIPAYGHVNMTLQCLASIAASPPGNPIEVLVVEDGSGDADINLYAHVTGLRFINRANNLGFLLSCNDAVKQTKGEFVFLLNNDTEVMPGAIDALVELFRSRPDAGLIGARLLYPDGRQQEAGGIVWKDGSAWNYGRSDDPRRPEYNYVREADYISGAAIMLPRALWNRLGGFNEHFAPAYFEDTDLAFRVRQAGFKVFYQPKAWVVHHEGVSHGKCVLAGPKGYQLINGRKFSAQWQETILREHYNIGAHIMRARDRAKNRKVILVIDQCVPESDRDAGSRTMFQFMEILLATGRVVKFWPANKYRSPGYTEALQQRGIEVLHGPWDPDFEKWIKKNGSEIDEVLLSRPVIAPMFLPALRKYSNAPVVFYGHDLHFMRMEREAQINNNLAKYNAAQEMKKLERRVWLSVDHVLYPSREETEKVFEMEPVVKASSVSIYGFPEAAIPRNVPPKESRVIFVAGYRHSPNISAAIWFCQEVLPLIRKLRADVSVLLIGSCPPSSVQALSGENVVVTGSISDEELDRHYAEARVAIIPLLFGAGIKMKAVEALYKGTPVVTTSVGAQGLDGVENVVDVVNDPVAFAEAVVRLLNDNDLWVQRSAAQINYSRDRFSIEALHESLMVAFNSTATFSNRTAA